VAYRTVTSVDEFDATVPRAALREIETTGFSIRNSSRFELGRYLTVVTVGADTYRDEQTGRDTTVAGQTRPGVPNGESEFTGAFIQSETRIDTGVGEFLIIPGVRYDRFESTSTLAPGQSNKDSEVSPRIGVTYLPTTWLTVFGTRSQGFRAPSINELYLDGVHFNVPHPVLGPRSGIFATNRFVSNPNLVPEHATTEEFGFGVDFKGLLTTGDRLQGKFTRYESDVTDLIDLRIDFAFSPTCFAPPRFTPCAAGTSTSANIKRAELNGWDFDVSYLNGPLSLSAAYGQIDGKNPVDGSSIGSLTPDRFTLTGSWLFAAQDLRVGARLEAAERFRRSITSARADFVTVDARDAYQVVDLFASWTPEALNGMRIDAGIDNLFDENYERVFAGVSEPGRNVKLALSWQFGG
jgi:hemoglobin/transferrin/lactoferrin receptor protein